MKKFNTITPRLFQLFFAGILSIFVVNSSQAQCLSGLNYTYTLTASATVPDQCALDAIICVTVNDPSLAFLTFSLSSGVDTDSQPFGGPFAAGQEVCQNLAINITPCNESTTLINIDVEGSGASSGSCVGANYDGPLDNPNGGPLAVEFAYLSGYQSKNDVMLEWITETETSNDYFEIEHSIDGRNFEFVEKIDGAGNSADANVYNYAHRFPFSGKNYYKIKMIDFAGEITYSNLITIDLESRGVVNIFPTTVESILNVKIFEVNNENVPVSIYNAAGNEIGNYIISTGDNSLQIPTSNLTAGIYYMKIKLKGEGVITKPFIKKTL